MGFPIDQWLRSAGAGCTAGNSIVRGAAPVPVVTPAICQQCAVVSHVLQWICGVVTDTTDVDSLGSDPICLPTKEVRPSHRF